VKTWHFQSALFLTDSQSDLTLFPRPGVSPTKVLLGYLYLSDSLSSRVALIFQWVPGHAEHPGNKLEATIAKNAAKIFITYAPSPLAPCNCKDEVHPLRYTWRRNLAHNSLFCKIPSVFSEKLALSLLASYKLSPFRCNGQSILLFSSYLCRIKRKENSTCSACGYQLLDLTHLILNCPSSEPLRRAIFGNTSFISDLWSRP